MYDEDLIVYFCPLFDWIIYNQYSRKNLKYWSDIRLGLLLNWILMCVLLCIYFSTLARGIGEGWDLINMFNPTAFLRLSHVRSLWPLLVLYYFNFSFLCTIWSLVWRSLSLHKYICLGASWRTPPVAGISRYIEDLLVTFCCCFFYGRVVVSLTHSPFPF